MSRRTIGSGVLFNCGLDDWVTQTTVEPIQHDCSDFGQGLTSEKRLFNNYVRLCDRTKLYTVAHISHQTSIAHIVGRFDTFRLI